MNFIQSNGYYVPVDNVFYATVQDTETSLTLATSEQRLHFEGALKEEVEPLLLKSGFVSFGRILINPARVSYLRVSDTAVTVFGGEFSVRFMGEEAIEKAVSLLSPKKRGK